MFSSAGRPRHGRRSQSITYIGRLSEIGAALNGLVCSKKSVDDLSDRVLACVGVKFSRGRNA